MSPSQKKWSEAMWNVTIIKGAFAGKTGTANPSRAIGPASNRTFMVLVTVAGIGVMEYPIDAIKIN
jgi:hypothetical protein